MLKIAGRIQERGRCWNAESLWAWLPCELH